MGRFTVSAFVFVWVCLIACSRAEPQAPPPSAADAPAAAKKSEAAFGERPDAVPADLPGAKSPAHAHMNLQNLVHLADFERGGLFLDFGTPARHKYTVGNWKSGWSADGAAGDTTYTNVASSGRLYLPLAGNEAVVFRFRIKPIGTGTLQVYVNNAAQTAVKLDKGSDFAEYDVSIAASATRAGENNINLRFGGTKKVGDEEIAAAIDWLRVLPAAAAATPQAVPVYGELVRDVAVG